MSRSRSSAAALALAALAGGAVAATAQAPEHNVPRTVTGEVNAIDAKPLDLVLPVEPVAP